MKFDPQKHHRRSIRLPEYDYSRPGAYFVTMVTYRRECLFGGIRNGKMYLNEAGQIVLDMWNFLPARYPTVTLGTAVVMPNHFHGIVVINEPPVGVIHELPLRETQSRAQRRRMTLPLVAGYFKMNSAKQINKLLNSSGIPIWQRNYYEHIIRNDDEHNRIHLYIESNIDKWEDDDENPDKRS
jgi:REP element-mobilizing transposase RayT